MAFYCINDAHAAIYAINKRMLDDKNLENPTALEMDLTSIISSWQVEPDVAECVARNMVHAHLSGHNTHGVQLLPRYKKWLEIGILHGQAALESDGVTGNLVRFDAHKSFGHWALPVAIRETSIVDEDVKAFGIKNLGHTGYVAGCLKECQVEDHIILLWLNTSSSRLAVPYGGKSKLMSSSVVACRMPGGYILDMTTPVTAENAVHHAWQCGQNLDVPLIQEDGSVSHDPQQLYAQTPHGPNAIVSKTGIPFKDHKMFNLGLVSEILAGLLTGSGTSQGNSFHSGCFGILVRANGQLAPLIQQYLNWIKTESGARIPGDRTVQDIDLWPWERKIIDRFKENQKC